MFKIGVAKIIIKPQFDPFFRPIGRKISSIYGLIMILVRFDRETCIFVINVQQAYKTRAFGQRLSPN